MQPSKTDMPLTRDYNWAKDHPFQMAGLLLMSALIVVADFFPWFNYLWQQLW